jgi:hypothetical protein
MTQPITGLSEHEVTAGVYQESRAKYKLDQSSL